MSEPNIYQIRISKLDRWNIFYRKKNDIVLSKGYEEVPQFESRIHRIEIINYFFISKDQKEKHKKNWHSKHCVCGFEKFLIHSKSIQCKQTTL